MNIVAFTAEQVKTVDIPHSIPNTKITIIGKGCNVPFVDNRDCELVKSAFKEYALRGGPAVGDWIIFSDGVKHRFSHHWGDSIQTSQGGSFYMDASGYVSFSGGLSPAVPIGRIQPAGEYEPGLFWSFHRQKLIF